MSHAFILSPGEWIGEGSITIAGAARPFRFRTRWEVMPLQEGAIQATQRVELIGEEAAPMINRFSFSALMAETFVVDLSSDFFGTVHGKGVVDDKRLAWEFHEYPTFEGFEVYELKKENEYVLHAEFVQEDEETRSFIEGRLWKKVEK